MLVKILQIIFPTGQILTTNLPKLAHLAPFATLWPDCQYIKK